MPKTAQPAFILGSGEIFQSQNAKDTESLRYMGLAEATPEDLRHDALKKQYSDWYYSAEAGALGVANTLLPGGTGTIVKGLSAISPEMGKNTGEFIEGVEAAWPKTTMGGRVAGALTGGAALAKAGAGTFAGTTLAAGAQAAGMTLDDQAIQHIQTPEGAEKIAASMASAFLLGGAMNVASLGLFTALGGGAVGAAGAAIEKAAPKVGQKVASAGASVGLFSTMGGNLPGMATGAATWASGKVVVPNVLTGAGKFLQGFDDVVVKGLGAVLTDKVPGTNNLLGPLAGKLLGLNDYTAAAVKAKWASENPTLAVPQIAQQMEQAGVPGEFIDAAIPQFIKGLQYLNTVAPTSPWTGQTVAPMEWRPPLGAQAKYMDQVNTVNNPLWALANPTPDRVETLKAVYPIITQKFANIVAQEAVQRPQASLAVRRRASALVGLPATPMSTPGAQVMSALTDAQASQPQAAQTGQSNQNSILTGQTRLNRMSEQ